MTFSGSDNETSNPRSTVICSMFALASVIVTTIRPNDPPKHERSGAGLIRPPAGLVDRGSGRVHILAARPGTAGRHWRSSRSGSAIRWPEISEPGDGLSDNRRYSGRPPPGNG